MHSFKSVPARKPIKSNTPEYRKLPELFGVLNQNMFFEIRIKRTLNLVYEQHHM